MTTFQRVIKYCAIAFAVFLIVSIVGGIIAALSYLGSFLDGDSKEIIGEMKTYEVNEEVTDLQINLSGTELKIANGNRVYVESNHLYISVNVENGKLIINETKKFHANYNGVILNLYIPNDFSFKDVNVETGAGVVEIETLECDTLKLSLGAGKVDIKNLVAHNKSKIDGGAGKVTIEGGNLNNLDLDMGVGALIMTNKLEGRCYLEFGVGETVLTLIGSLDDYSIEVDKGIGEATISGETFSENKKYGTGVNEIEIDGGVGAIRISFSK